MKKTLIVTAIAGVLGMLCAFHADADDTRKDLIDDLIKDSYYSKDIGKCTDALNMSSQAYRSYTSSQLSSSDISVDFANKIDLQNRQSCECVVEKVDNYDHSRYDKEIVYRSILRYFAFPEYGYPDATISGEYSNVYDQSMMIRDTILSCKLGY